MSSWNASSYRGSLSQQQLRKIAKTYLENARNEEDPRIALVYCHHAEETLSQAKKAGKNAINKTVVEGIIATYVELGRLFESHGQDRKAEACMNEAMKLVRMYVLL
jgi:uncharacterized protein HemY